MNLVQIATSVEHGALYYDLSARKIYYVPYTDLFELNNVRFANLTGWVFGSTAVVIGIVMFIQNKQYTQDISHLLLLLLVILILSSCAIIWAVKRNQNRISCLIREKYRTIDYSLNLSHKMKCGQTIYKKMGIYTVLLFCFAIVSFGILVQSSEILYAFSFVTLFDAGVMMIAILQPLGKLSAYFNIKKGGYNNG